MRRPTSDQRASAQSARAGPTRRLVAYQQAERRRIHRLADLARRPDPDVEVYHELHRALRRRQGALDLARSSLGGRRTIRAAERMAGLAHGVGAVRDLQVAGTLLDRLRSSARAGMASELRAAQAELGRRERAARRALGPALRQLDAEPDTPAWGRSGPRAADDRRLVRQLRRRLEGHRRNLADQGDRAVRRPTVRRLHRLRMALRTRRHSAELAAYLLGGRPPRVPGRLVRLQHSLGTLHDWAQLRRILRQGGIARHGGPVDRELRRRVRRLRHGAIEALGGLAGELDRWRTTPRAAGRPATRG